MRSKSETGRASAVGGRAPAIGGRATAMASGVSRHGQGPLVRKRYQNQEHEGKVKVLCAIFNLLFWCLVLQLKSSDGTGTGTLLVSLNVVSRVVLLLCGGSSLFMKYGSMYYNYGVSLPQSEPVDIFPVRLVSTFHRVFSVYLTLAVYLT